MNTTFKFKKNDLVRPIADNVIRVRDCVLNSNNIGIFLGYTTADENFLPHLCKVYFFNSFFRSQVLALTHGKRYITHLNECELELAK